jgi:hypothetical protein
MFPKPFRLVVIRARRSSALVLTLAGLVLISGLLLIFFDQSTLNRRISFSSASQDEADILAHSALDYIVGDLRTEIAAGSASSASYTSNSIPIYVPTGNSTAAPFRVSDQSFANLVAQSASSFPFWSGNGYGSTFPAPIRSAANNSTLIPSQNGRYISTGRWNEPGLLGDPGSGTAPQGPNAAYTTPDWIVITRQGAVTNASSADPSKPSDLPAPSILANNSDTNSDFVVGRYAYTIYNEGGLLDMNVAGYPSSVATTDFPTKRGLLPQVDVANLLGNAAVNDPTPTTDANALVGWRNQATATSANAYTNYVMTTTNGFTAVASLGGNTDQAFVSRQDLINYIKTKANGNQIPTSALQYLGTFSRELNAPSYTPGVDMAQNTIQSAYKSFQTTYQTNNLQALPGGGTGLPYGLDAEFNPSLINIRVSTGFTRAVSLGMSDDSAAVPGEPLIKHRFPLSRLAWIGYNGPAGGATAAQILGAFGLTWEAMPGNSAVGNVWVYSHGDANRILTLAEVAAAGREPDFFELLQAGIEVGSLGNSHNNTVATNNLNTDGNTYFQILQIGVNAIDQYQTGSYPTRVYFAPAVADTGAPSQYLFCGLKNLPYLNRILFIPYRVMDSGNVPDPAVSCWAIFEVWNPHAQAQAAAASGPQKFRIVAENYSYCDLLPTKGGPPLNSPAVNLGSPKTVLGAASGGGGEVDFSAANFSSPILLTASNASSPNASGKFTVTTTDGPANLVGMLLGQVTAADNVQSPLYQTAQTYSTVGSRSDPAPYVHFYLQYASGNQWLTYSCLPYENLGSSTSIDNAFTVVQLPDFYHERPDPRTSRLGTGDYWVNIPLGSTLRPDSTSGYSYRYEQGPGSVTNEPLYPGWTLGADPGGTGTYFLGPISENNPKSSVTYYSDVDGVVRLADGAYANGTIGLPLATGNFDSRPLNLNRPFRSVADLGYVFRDAPWKQLDFFTSNSADAALLDLFCLNESPPSGVEAGRVDLNTRQPIVLSSVLTGAIQSEADNTTLSSSDAASIANAIVSWTSNPANGPLLNRSEMVTKLANIYTYPGGANPSEDSVIKRRREASVRALADVSNARTWNLLIDVIAQSGRYPKNASDLNHFVVEGERRYWLHVAIDRYTGKVIAQQLEPVYE